MRVSRDCTLKDVEAPEECSLAVDRLGVVLVEYKGCVWSRVGKVWSLHLKVGMPHLPPITCPLLAENVTITNSIRSFATGTHSKTCLLCTFGTALYFDSRGLLFTLLGNKTMLSS